MNKNFPFIDSALRTIEIERSALADLPGRIGAEFEAACRIILSCGGRVAVTGMGKSGHIGNKIAATLSSTGTPALYVHPAEAAHGDIGMITGADVVLAISNSGATAEIIALLPMLGRRGIPLIARPAGRLELARFRHRQSGRQCARGSLPAGPGADLEHHRGARTWRRAGHVPARSAGIQH